MKNKRFLISLAIFIILTIFGYNLNIESFLNLKEIAYNEKSTQNDFYEVVKVVDGDTILVKINGKDN